MVKEVVPKEGLRVVEPSIITRKAVDFIHEREYAEYVADEGKQGFHYIDSDTYVNEHTFRVALLAASATWNAADIALEVRAPVLALVKTPDITPESLVLL